MAKKKILYIAPEIYPYLPESYTSHICRYLPQGIQECDNEIRTFMPKIVWFNSTLRRLGRLPIKSIKDENIKKLMMYHDLWYFHPYPSLVTQESMIMTPLTLKNYIKSGNTKNPLKIIAIIYKYISVSLLKKRLTKTIDTHLVPSEFMEGIVIKSYKISNKKIKTLSHFIQK